MELELEGSHHAYASQPQVMMATIRRSAPHLLQKVQNGLSKLELVSVPHPAWPFPQSNPPRQYNNNNPLKISILDSSFNPPTLAHLALANSKRDQNNGDSHYDAKLLLLSVKNADKTLKPGDATYQQRLEMMSLLSMDVKADIDATITPSSNSSSNSNVSNPVQDANVAIAIIDEPTFVGKSEALLAFLQSRAAAMSLPMSNIEKVELTFLIGHDTLERLFSQRYYPSEEAMMKSLRRFFSPAPDGDNSRIVSARRDLATQSDDKDAMSIAQEFIDAGKITIIDMGDEISTYSSTTVRRSLGSLGWGQDSLWRKLVTPAVAEYIVEQRLYEVGL